MSRAGVISGTPTSAGFTRFWIWNHDLTFAEGGPDWCQREDRSEREFSIYIDPGLEIENETLKGPTIGQPYSDTLTAKQVVTLNPPTGTDVQARGPSSRGRFRRVSPSRRRVCSPGPRRLKAVGALSSERRTAARSIRRHTRSPSASP